MAKKPKYDLYWEPEHNKMGKGLTLTMDDLKALKEILNGMKWK